MVDFRSYKDTIKAAVAAERERDENWGWTVKTINKSVVKIGWGYLDYLGEKDAFTVEILVGEDSDESTIVGTIPNGKKVYCWVGSKHWHDCKSVERGIALVIHGMAASAHSTY